MYIAGILEGRQMRSEHGISIAVDELANLEHTVKQFDASSPVGQLLRGQRDFWRLQLKMSKP